MTAALLALLLSVTPAEHAEAERLARQSITDYNVGDFDSALREATQAYKLDPKPALLFNLGQVHRALHHWERAEFFFRGYLRERPGAPNRAAVERLIAEMQARQAETPRPPQPAPPPTILVKPLPPPSAPAPTPAPAAPPPQVPLVLENAPALAPAPTAAPAAAPNLAPPPLAPPRTVSAQASATSEPEQPPTVTTKSHTAAYILGGIALAAAGCAVAGLVERLQYDSWIGSLRSATPGTYSLSGGPAGAQTQTQANIWTVSAYVLAGVAAAGGIGAIVAW